MSSLSELRKKLQILQAQKNQRTEESQQHEYNQREDHTGNTTSEVTDHTAWLARIQDEGNRPQEWLEYTRFIRDRVQFSDEGSRFRYLSGFYTRAMEVISTDLWRDNEDYISLLIDCAKFRSEYDEELAESDFAYARSYAHRHALVHIAAAEFELARGNKQKARKILEKAKRYNAEPVQYLNIAFKNLIVQNRTPLLSEEDKVAVQEAASSCNDSDQTADEQHLQPLQPLRSSRGRQKTSPDPHSCSGQVSAKTTLDPQDLLRSSTGRTLPSPQDLLRPMIGGLKADPGGTVLQGQETAPSCEVSPPWCRDPSPGISFPAQQSVSGGASVVPSSKNVTGTTAPVQRTLYRDTVFTPTQPSCRPSPAVQGVKHSSVQIDTTISFKVPSKSTSRAHSSTSSDDSDTVPMGALGLGKKTLRSCHSTPDCKNPGPLTQGSATKRWMTGLNLKPMRVKRTSLPKLYEMAEEKSSLEDTEGDDDGHSYRLQPLDDVDMSMTGAKQPSIRLQDSDQGDTVSTADSGIHNSLNLDSNVGSRLWEKRNSQPMETSLNLEELIATHPHQSHITNKASSTDIPRQMNSARRRSSLFEPMETDMSHPQRPDIPKTKPLSTPVGRRPEQEPLGHSQARPQQHVQYLHTPRHTEVLAVNGKTYSVLKVIGKGGSSKVYEVFDPDRNLRAVKYVNLDDADDQTKNSYQNEIILLKRLQYSDKIIKLYDFEYNEETNSLYVVMERGDTDLATLFHDRKKRGQISGEMRKFYWVEMLQAVMVLHKEGIIHSDLKPANFLLVAGNLKLIDFGIANAIQQDKTSVILDQRVGTFNYMSPEAIMDTCSGTERDEAGKIKPRIKMGVQSDVWSLGCILYNMTYGKTPFQSIINPLAKLQAITSPTFQIDFPPLEDEQLVAVLKKCLERDPKQRPSIDELLRHPYLKQDDESRSAGQMGLTQENLQRLMLQLSQANVNSPGSIRTLSEGVLRQLESGKQVDVSSLLVKKNTAPGRENRAPPPIPLELKPHTTTYISKPK